MAFHLPATSTCHCDVCSRVHTQPFKCFMTWWQTFNTNVQETYLAYNGFNIWKDAKVNSFSLKCFVDFNLSRRLISEDAGRSLNWCWRGVWNQFLFRLSFVLHSQKFHKWKKHWKTWNYSCCLYLLFHGWCQFVRKIFSGGGVPDCSLVMWIFLIESLK